METGKNNSTFAGGKQVDTTSYWIEEKDGNGFPVKHLNFNNPDICPRKGIIVYEPMRVQRGVNGGKKHSSRISHRRFIDNSTGTSVVAGIPVNIDKATGEYTYRQILLNDIESLDLSIDGDAKKNAVLRLSPLVFGSPNASNNRPEYKVYDREREAEQKLQGRQIKRKAVTIAEGISSVEELRDMCRVSGININGLSQTRLQVALIDYAEDNSQVFLDNYSSPLRQQNFIFKKALDLDIIQQDAVNGYMFRGLPLGQTEPQAVEYLKEHVSTSSAIQSQTELKESDSAKSIMPLVLKVNDDKDVLLNEQAKEIAELRKRIQGAEQKKIDDEYNSSETKTLTDLDMLREEASKLGMKGVHLHKDPEKIKIAIEKHKANN